MKNKFALVLFFVFVIGCSPCLSKQYASGDNINLNIKAEKGTLIDIFIALSDLPELYWNPNSWHWGTEFLKPKLIITKLSVKYDGKTVFVPFSAFSDLANINEAMISTSGDRYIVEIKGGDAATSYTAVILFDGLDIKSRKVTHGEFQDAVWEETIYSFQKLE